MNVKHGILCEILFIDRKSGTPISIIGRLEEYQLGEFNLEYQSNFISFIESYIPPVCKADIEEIIVYDDEDGVLYPVEHGKLQFTENGSSKPKIKARIN